MIDGVRNPRKLADLAGRRLKATPKQLYDALHGRLTETRTKRLVAQLARLGFEAQLTAIARVA
jgi:hypothetical protein